MIIMFNDDNPHFPALRSDPMALSGASRRKQISSSNSSSTRAWGGNDYHKWPGLAAYILPDTESDSPSQLYNLLVDP